VFGAARDALVVIDLHTDRIVRWNPAAENLFGYAASDAIGQTIQSLMPPDLAQLHREHMAHYIRTREREILLERRPITTPALHQTGARLTVELRVVPLDPTVPTPRWVLLTFRDVACHRKPDAATPALGSNDADVGAKARASDAQLSERLGDLYLPLARARRAAERLARCTREGDATDSKRLRRLADLVEARTCEAQRAIEHLSIAESIASGTFEVQLNRVNLVPLANRVVSEMRVVAPLHRVKLAAPQGLTAICDATRIETVLENLIKRAVRRNPRGCWIDVDLRRPLVGVAEIEVRDYGRPPSERERQRLVAQSPTADRGWFIDRHIVEQHGGTLSVEYPPGGGMRVALSLPMHRGRLIARGGGPLAGT
jgi:two-component system sensor kinase FixL